MLPDRATFVSDAGHSDLDAFVRHVEDITEFFLDTAAGKDHYAVAKRLGTNRHLSHPNRHDDASSGRD